MKWPNDSCSNPRGQTLSASKRIGSGSAHLAQDFFADLTDWTRKRTLSDGVESVAVDDGRLVESDIDSVNLNLRGEASDRRRHFSDGNKVSNVKDL